MSNLSSALKLTDLNDFLLPAETCIKIGNSKITPKKSKTVHLEPDKDYGVEYRKTEELMENKLEKATYNLNDCLACSGCITSAESILISAQSKDELLKVIRENKEKKKDKKCIVASISTQTCASIASKYNLSLKEASQKLVSFLKVLGFDYVFSNQVGLYLSLLELAKEFVTAYKKQLDNEDKAPIQMLTSACPGWICYAEKTQEMLIPYLSRTKSPQQIMGAILKYYFSQKICKNAADMYHVSFMPCYDKKLEASRKDFYNDIYRTTDVDCVITTEELDSLFEVEKLVTFPASDFDLLDEHDSKDLFQVMGSGTGGFLEFVLHYAGEKLFGMSVDPVLESEMLQIKTLRNSDYKEYILERNGEVLLKFAAVYGFRNIQNLVRKIKTKKSGYHFVEVMACPSGCLNGGGQLKPQEQGRVSAKEWLANVVEKYSELLTQCPMSDSFISHIYNDWLNGENSTQLLHTSFKAVKKSAFTQTAW